jgi:small-conductance mechanosensitive channel
MTETHSSQGAPRVISWPARVLYGLALATVLVVGFFFLTVALIAGAFVALAILARLWWISRRVHHSREQAEIEGEFAVIEGREAIRRLETPRRRR